MKNFNLNQERTNENRLRNTINWLIDITIAIVLAVFLVQNLGESIQITGSSMEPLLQSGDSVLVDKINYHFFSPKRLDLVAFQKEDAASKIYVKRVIGLPGETVQIKEGTIYIDGEELSLEHLGYISLPGLASEPIVLKKNEYFLLGDNMESSEDSRFSNIGNVTKKQMIGKIWFQIEPFDEIGFIKN